MRTSTVLLLLSFAGACGEARDEHEAIELSEPIASGAVEGSVAWTDEGPGEIEIDRDVALLYAFPYRAEVPEDGAAWSLQVERCFEEAGQDEVCVQNDLPAVTGEGFARFEIDPSVYEVGENRYRLTLSLAREAEVVDVSTLEITAVVTSCTRCGGEEGRFGREP